MGASTVKLFDDDLAADVRDLFRELLARGTTGPQATAVLIDDFEEIMQTPEEPVFWLALAAVQWEYGLLEPPVLQRARRIIEDGSDLARWADDPGLQDQRRKVLAALYERLNSPNSKPKKARLKKRQPPTCDWEVGDVFAYQLPSKQFLLMRVVEVHKSRVQDLVVCELLDWVGAQIPPPEVVARLPIRRNKRYPSESMFQFPLLKKHISRCQSLGLRLPPAMRDDGSYLVPLNFNDLPAALQDVFGLSIE